MGFLSILKDEKGHGVSKAEIEKYVKTLGKDKEVTPLDVIDGLNIKNNGSDAEIANTYNNMWSMLETLNRERKIKFIGYKKILKGGLKEFNLPKYASV